MNQRTNPFVLVLPIAVAAMAMAGCTCTPAPNGSDGGEGDGGANLARPEGYASLTFRVDDRANKSYRAGQLFWKGTFQVANTVCTGQAGQPAGCDAVASLSKAVRETIVFFDPSWGGAGDGDPGPWPTLWDDGPIARGGHEGPDEVAGDNVHSVEVWTRAEVDTNFEYGLTNEDYNWIWSGKNGAVKVSAGSTDVIAATGYTIATWGPIDMKVTFDCTKAAKTFRDGFPPSCGGTGTGGDLAVFIKGTVNSWKPVAMADDGKRGDAVAGDHVYTYVQSQNLGPHDGKLPDLPGLALGQHVQFTLVFFDERGSEYKAAGKGVADGVAAFTNYDSAKPTELLPETIVLEEESRGSAKNTTVVVGFEGTTNTPQIQFVDPNQGVGGDTICVRGLHLAGGTVTFGTAQATGASKCADNTPPSGTALPVLAPAGTPGATVDVTVTTSNGTNTFPGGFTYRTGGTDPTISSVVPNAGSTLGNEQVSVYGINLDKVVRVSFGGSDASGVAAIGASRVDCVTPAHAAGVVEVTVYTSDSRQASRANAFTFAAPSLPQPTSVNPAAGGTAGGDWVTVFGSSLAGATSVKFGSASATSLDVSNDGKWIRVKTPAGTGTVDVEVTTGIGTGTLSGAFTYSATPPALVGWCDLQWPASLSAAPGATTASIYGWVYQTASTPGVGQGPGIVAEVGVGPAGTDPAAGTWTWSPAAYGADKDGTSTGDKANDEYQGTVTAPSTAGAYNYAFRFKLTSSGVWRHCDLGDCRVGGCTLGVGSSDGYSPKHAGALTVQ